MQFPRALLCALALYPAPSLVAQDAHAVPGEFSVGGATIRLARQDGRPAAIRRVGDADFRALPEFDARLWLRIGTFDPRTGTPALPGALEAPAGCRLFVVQTSTSIVPEYHDALLAAGLEIVAFFPKNAYVVRGDARTVQTLAGTPWVRWTGPLPVGWRLEETLLEAVANASAAADQPVEYNVVLAKKTDRAALGAAIAALGGAVTNENGDSVYLQARLTHKQLAAVAALDTVLWIDATTPIENDMDNARIQGGANYVRSAAGYTGTGVRAEISEGVDQAHPDWIVPVLTRYNSNNDDHGHCTASIVGLGGTNNTAATGVMPNCQIIESSHSAWGATSRYNVIQGSVNPSLQWKAMQQTASWGNTTTTSYTSVSAEMDNALFDFDLATTQSQSNTNNRNSRPQAWAKNIISVGGVRHNNNSNPADDVWNGASIGPANDNRIKPEICAYYDAILCGDRVGTAGYTTTNYYSNFGGTSGATPICNGYLGLIQEMFTDGLFHNPLPLPATANNRFDNKPHMTTAKLLLCNTAKSYPFSGTSANLTRVHQGWGFPDMQRIYDNRDKIVVIDEYEVLRQGESKTWLVWIAPNRADFRVGLAWADDAAAPNAAITLLNDLNLSVRNFANRTTWWGNNGLTAGNTSTSGGVANDRDTLEQVWLTNPDPGIYEVTVAAPTLVRDGHVETPQIDADFALAFHPVDGGYHDDTGMSLDLTSSGPGNVTITLNNVPATGWTDGFTFFSLNTFGKKGFAPFFGLQADFITSAIFGEPASAGGPFHFTNTQGGYPFQPFTFPPSLALALSGLQVDGMVMLFDNGNVAGLSNVDRVTVQ